MAWDVLSQCREEYDFVVSELRSEFEEGKRQFLTDLKSLAMGYHDRMHGMLRALIRDLLAMLFLLTLGVGSKLVEKPELVSSRPFSVLLTALGVYILASGAFQGALHLLDFFEMRRLAQIWAENTRGFMRKESVQRYIAQFTSRARGFFLVCLLLWIGLYATMGWFLLCRKEFIQRLATPVAGAPTQATSQTDQTGREVDQP